MKTRTIDVPEFGEEDISVIDLAVSCGVESSHAAILYGIMAFPEGISQKGLTELADVSANDISTFQQIEGYKNLYQVDKIASVGRGRPSHRFKPSKDVTFLKEVCEAGLQRKKASYEAAAAELAGYVRESKKEGSK